MKQLNISTFMFILLISAGIVNCKEEINSSAFMQGELENKGIIVFDSDRTGVRQVYSMNPDGSSLKILTSGNYENMCPAVSFDGSKIAYMSKANGNFDLFIMNRDGSGKIQLTDSPEDESSAEFSYDCSKIFYVKTIGEKAAIWEMNIDGRNKKQISGNRQYNNERPRLSPDGKTILFMSDREGKYDIYLMNPDGTNERRLFNTNEMRIFPAWSPDGKQIVYSINNYTSYPQGEIYIVNSDGLDNRRITNSGRVSEDPVFSPDGNKILFQSDRSGNFEVYIMNSDGSELKQLTATRCWNGWPGWGK